ncbi:MAG: tetratricopeptide repeat protein [Kofleriaceae bacterium]
MRAAGLTLAAAVGFALGLTPLTPLAPVGVAHAQVRPKEIELDRGPTADLYIRKRPPAPAAPALSEELRALLESTETRRDDKRLEAIGLLREFLDSAPSGEARADGTFKLAELLWEEARRTYLLAVEEFSRKAESCRQTSSKAGDDRCGQEAEPRIQLAEPAALYRDLHDHHPTFRRMDLVTYLIGFAEKEAGREAQAMELFREVIERFPRSPLYGDSWMMIGEHHFAAADWSASRDAYAKVLAVPGAATYDLALFKSAWCFWKLGDVDTAARRFKEVLDLAVEAERSGTASVRRRRASLRDEALEYLVVVFTEDRSISAQEVFDFLASIGGERYSRDVLIKVAESYVGQGETERATEAYRFLIKMDADSLKAAEFQREIVSTWVAAIESDRAQAEIGVLLKEFGPGTSWAKAQRNREALGRSLEATEELVRTTAIGLHGEAQQAEKASKKVDRNLYTRAADAYQRYLDAFGGKDLSAKAAELRYYRADILYFKLGQLEVAGDEYLAVGKTAPVGPLHKDALLQAMAAYEKARPTNTAGKRELLPVDRKFAEAIDLYATLFPADQQLVSVIFRNGQLFFDYGDYDEAIKRFGLIVTKYPDHENAGPAGDRILAALSKAQDYENIEDWARKLKKAKAFSSKDQQQRLDRLIVDSLQKSGDKYAEAGKYEQAAGFYLRVPKEFPSHPDAAQAMMNAGVMHEKAKQPEQAAAIYLEIAEKFATSSVGEKAAVAAAQVYERVLYYDRAAKVYELVVTKFGKSAAAVDALYNAGLLRQALGQNDQAIAHYQTYAKRYRERKDAADVAFNIGAVYEDAGDDGRAEQAFRDYVKSHRGGRRVIEANMRAGRCAIRLGQLRRAREALAAALSLHGRLSSKEKEGQRAFAAEARYWEAELVFREYEQVTLDVKPSKLNKALKRKSKLLEQAQSVYTSVVAFGDLRWATAALYRVGQTFDLFSEALTNAATPAGLTEAEASSYRDALDLYVIDIQDKAIQLFSTGYQKSIELQVYDQYTAKIREALGRLAADRYPPEREAREKVRSGDRPLMPELVTEIVR